MTTPFANWLKKAPKTWTPATVLQIVPPADLDRADAFVPHPTVPRLFLRFRRGPAGFGAGTYTAIYHRGGRDHRTPLGKVGEVAPAEAVAQAMKLFAAALDPTQDPAAERAEAKEGQSRVFKTLVPRYVTHMRAKGLKVLYITRTERYLVNYFPTLANREVGKIKRAECAEAIARTLQRGRGTATQARAALNAFFEWLIGSGYCEANPVVKSLSYKKERHEKRTRFLTEPELALVLEALPGGRVGRVFKLIALTACRRVQIGALRKDWVHLDAPVPTIRLPGKAEPGWADIAGGSKNGLPFTIPLSRQAAAVLREAMEHAELDTDFVFGRARAAGGFTGFHEAMVELRDELGDTVPHWTLHDLRDTFATLMSKRLGAKSINLIDACLNHTVGSDILRTYNHDEFEGERAEVMQAWADYCDSLVPKPALRLVA